MNLDKHSDKCTSDNPWFGQIISQLAVDNSQDGIFYDLCSKSLEYGKEYVFFKYKNKIINWKDSWGEDTDGRSLSRNLAFMMTNTGIFDGFANDTPLLQYLLKINLYMVLI